MNMQKTTRQLYPAEQKMLKLLLNKSTKEAAKPIKYHHVVIAGVIAVFCTYLATIQDKDNFLLFVFGTTAVLGYGYIIFMPHEIYKERKRIKMLTQNLQDFMDKGVVDTCRVTSKRVALAPEYEDESDLYIVELDNQKVLYLWDLAYNLNKKFPCSEFEIYEDAFFKLTGRQIYPLSEKFKPLKIDAKAKWNFMKKYYAPAHLDTEDINFDQLLEKYNACL